MTIYLNTNYATVVSHDYLTDLKEIKQTEQLIKDINLLLNENRKIQTKHGIGDLKDPIFNKHKCDEVTLVNQRLVLERKLDELNNVIRKNPSTKNKKHVSFGKTTTTITYDYPKI